MKHFIITGHSKGLGAGIVTQLMDENYHIHGISRTDNIDLQKLAKAKGCTIDFYSCDLGHTDEIEPVMQQIFAKIKPEETEGVYLINNAGLIKPIGPIETLDPAEMDLHMRVNLLAPMLIIREFIKATTGWQIQKRVLNISSGAATNPYYGWSNYCTGKAGLDMFTRSCATEQEKKQYPVELMAVAPGIIDTGMQTTIRGTTEEQFIHRQKFVDLKESGQLIAPNLAGKKIQELLLSNDFTNGAITDIRDQYN